MRDFGLFALGLFVGIVALAFGPFGGPALLLVLSVMSGVSDGKRHLRVRWVWSWAPALLGLLAFPLFLMSIFKEQFVEPRASHGGVPLWLVLSVLSAVATGFVALTLTISAITRRSKARKAAPLADRAN